MTKRIRFICPKCGKEILSCNYGADLRVDGLPVEKREHKGMFCGDCHQPCIRADVEIKRPPPGPKGGRRIFTP